MRIELQFPLTVVCGHKERRTRWSRLITYSVKMTGDPNHTDEKPPAVGAPDEHDSELESGSPAASTERKEVDFDNDEFVLDHGFKAWSQVFGSFFLFFNSWYGTIFLVLWLEFTG